MNRHGNSRCPRCASTGHDRGKRCRACNPDPWSLDDRIAGFGQRIADRLTGTTHLDTATGTRTTRLGRETRTTGVIFGGEPQMPACTGCGKRGEPLTFKGRARLCPTCRGRR